MPDPIDIEKERALVAAMSRNERSAFDEVVGLLRYRGYCLAYRFLGNQEDAKDALQEAFIRVYTGIGGFRFQCRFTTWFYRIVVNCSLDFLRKRKGSRRMVSCDEALAAEVVGADTGKPDPLSDGEARLALEDCLAQLPDRQRTCFVLKHQDGLSNQEIADMLKCGVPTVKVHLFRAAGALRRKMAGYLRKREA